jgi:hypothetical protein
MMKTDPVLRRVDRSATSVRRRGGVWLAGLFCLAALWSSPAWAYCPRVEVEGISPLNLGMVRVRHGARGWAVLDPGGGFVVSPGATPSSGHPAMPGLFRIKAPPSSELTLSISRAEPSARQKGVTWRNFSLGERGRLLPKQGEFWTLRTRPSHSALVEVTLELGGELSFQPVDVFENFSVRVDIDCVAVRSVQG